MKSNIIEKRYLTFRRYLRDKYHCSVRKILIHANLTCPNRNGLSGRDGCIFCNNQAFHPFKFTERPIRDQILSQINQYKKNRTCEKFIAYFQTFTNTYASINHLKSIYNSVREFKDIIAISIGTRPDCVNSEILDLIESYHEYYDVWIEYGLQTARDKTLNDIHRGHTYQDFLNAVKMTQSRKILICVHVILGLPGETYNDILFTAREISQLPIQAIKFHPLQIIKDTPLEKLYIQSQVMPPDLKTYVNWIVRFMEILPESMVIQRVTADATSHWLIAPDWCKHKTSVIQMIDHEFERRKSRQGLYFQHHAMENIQR